MRGNATTTTPTRLVLQAAIAAAVAAAVLLAFGADTAPARIKQYSAQARSGTLTIDGDRRGGRLALRLRAGNPNKLEIDFGDNGTADRTFNRNRFDELIVDAGGGDDRIRIDEVNGVFTDTEQTTIDGDGGDDTLLGGSGAETFAGGRGDDLVDGNGGADRAFLGRQYDTFVWDPGDGSDLVEGGYGYDVLAFNGSSASESFEASPNGDRLRFLRDVGNIVMDVDGVERVDVAADAGADRLTTNDLAPTDVRLVNGALGISDGADDRAIVNATTTDDEIEARGAAGRAQVTGLAATVRIANAESGRDALVINALDGRDEIDGSGLAADAPSLVVQGGLDPDLMVGGDGNDAFDGDGAADTAFLGDGNDRFTWDPGDGSDIVEGQGGSDTLVFNGSAGDERFEVLQNGFRVRFLRNVGNISMDLGGIEQIDVAALGGSDRLNIGAISGTDLGSVTADLAGVPGGSSGDLASDEVIVNGTAAGDVLVATGANGSASMVGSTPAVQIANAESANDTLRILAGAGDDVVDASQLAANAIGLVVEGNDGDDVLLGGAGADTLLGQADDDVLIGGPGLDVLDGGTGNNVLLQD